MRRSPCPVRRRGPSVPRARCWPATTRPCGTSHRTTWRSCTPSTRCTSSPSPAPGFPPRFEGREAVRAGYRAAWGASPVQVKEIADITVHETLAPDVLIAEQVVVAALPGGGTVTVPGLLVLRVRDGLLVHVRDYLDGFGVARARGAAPD
ncbi:nuclear transport factor 2 family protein [Streptomyces sp. JW3]|uniref:nuclear transport factor 2 family protein n=1 Tax=Streptomyces sp. JW3 TaxID=3456955 RepID=UPI003FA4160D